MEVVRSGGVWIQRTQLEALSSRQVRNLDDDVLDALSSRQLSALPAVRQGSLRRAIEHGDQGVLMIDQEMTLSVNATLF